MSWALAMVCCGGGCVSRSASRSFEQQETLVKEAATAARDSSEIVERPSESTLSPTDELVQSVVFSNSDATVTEDSPVTNAMSIGSASVVDLDLLVQQALAVHPEIQAARHRVSAESNRVAQETALPDPTLGNTFWPFRDQALQTAGGRMAHQISLQQGLPYPKKLKTKGAIVCREVQMARAEVDRLERQITESVRLAYYEAWYADREIEILRQTQTLVDDLVQVAEARYRTGGTQQDVLRARLESDRLENQLVRAKQQKAVAIADLATLTRQSIESTTKFKTNDSIPSTLSQIDDLIVQAEQCNAQLQGLAAEIQRDRQQQRLACLERCPDFSVGVQLGIISDDSQALSPVANGHDNLSFTVGTTLPIWRGKINAGIREAQHRTSRSVLRLEAKRDQIHGQLRRLLAQADALVEQVKIYENRIIPRTETTLELAVADYRGDRTDFSAVIEIYRELLLFETQLARIKANLAGRIAQIDRTVGCPTSLDTLNQK